MKKLLLVHPDDGSETCQVQCLGHSVTLQRIGCRRSLQRARELIAGADGHVDAIALDGIPIRLQLGGEEVLHDLGRRLRAAAKRTPVVDGSGVRPCLERWAVTLAERAQPGILSHKRTLMVPGLNHSGLAHALSRRASHLRYADPAVFFRFPRLPGVGSLWSLESVAHATLNILRKAPLERLRPRHGNANGRRARALFRWAEVLAGDIEAIRGVAPDELHRKIVVVETAGEADLEDLRRHGVSVAVMLMPTLVSDAGTGISSAAALEGLLAALRRVPDLPLSEDTYLDMISEIQWDPEVRYLQPEDVGVNKFAFVIHPLDIGFIHRHPPFRWTRFLPDALVEAFAAMVPPMYVSRITGGRSHRTGQRIEGHLISLGATPRQLMKRSARFTYKKLNQAARLAQSRGARIMGLGAFTSVVGDAGVTVGQQSPIPVTSGNSLTVAATIAAAKQAAGAMGIDLSRGKAMVIGATGSIGSVCARMIAQATREIVLVSIEPEKLIELKCAIRSETPDARVTVATRSVGMVSDCDLIVTATSGFGQRILDISECRPGAVVCDVARPPDISGAEAALRPDVLVIESGEVLIPGDVEFGYNIGLPPRVSYACLGETALLAMAGRFESFTLGREISVRKVREIYDLFQEHGFELAGLRSLGRYLTDEDVEQKRQLAEALRADPERFAETRREAARRLAEIPRISKGVRSPREPVAARMAGRIRDGLAELALRIGRPRASSRP